jgi:hypothetical protein
MKKNLVDGCGEVEGEEGRRKKEEGRRRKKETDRAWCWVLEPLRMRYTGFCVAHNRRSKCHQKLPLEL